MLVCHYCPRLSISVCLQAQLNLPSQYSGEVNSLQQKTGDFARKAAAAGMKKGFPEYLEFTIE
jgi:hypothetical protein